MTTDVGQPPDFEQLIKQSRTKANKLFYLVIVLFVLFFISLVTAAPRWIDRAFAPAGTDSLDRAKEQSALWHKNASCAGSPPQWVEAANNLKVDTRVCPSGDVLIRVVTLDNMEVYRWVSIDDVTLPLRKDK